MVLWLPLAFGAPIEPSPRELRFGQLQVQAGVSAQLNGYSLSLLPLLEGWHPGSVSVDLGIARTRAVSVSLGVEGSAATQVLVNPFMSLRRRVGRAGFLLRAPGDEVDYRWRPTTLAYAGRVGVHLNQLEGLPFLLLGVQRDHLRLTATSRDTESLTGTGRFETTSAYLGAGANSVYPSGLFMSAEVRYIARLSTSDWNLDVGEASVPIVKRMRSPPPVLFRLSLGYRIGGRYRP